MTKQPNILFLMTDQMQGRTIGDNSPCLTPHFDQLKKDGVLINGAYAPNPVCSPSRASLMTGLLPHNHGVVDVTHCCDKDQSCLRDVPHFAQSLEKSGYQTAYVGKWHVERSNELNDYGWQIDCGDGSQRAKDFYTSKKNSYSGPSGFEKGLSLDQHEGYGAGLLYAVDKTPPEVRGVGLKAALAGEILEGYLNSEEPWCCFVSVTEPHDPFVCGQEAYALYDVEDLNLPENFSDDCSDKPGIYRKCADLFKHLSDHQKREAIACYYASVTEIDKCYGRLIDQVKASSHAENTIIILSSDHGEFLGAHGLYMKNVGAFEEAYNIPMLIAGPGLTEGVQVDARVGLHDLTQTLLEVSGCQTFDVPDSHSFLDLLKNPEGEKRNFQTGYAEFDGNRYKKTQRVLWHEKWKFVLNGFDYDELYNLEDDPGELHNLASDPQNRSVIKDLMKRLWKYVKDSNDHAILNSQYPCLRLAPFGPGILEED